MSETSLAHTFFEHTIGFPADTTIEDCDLVVGDFVRRYQAGEDTRKLLLETEPWADGEPERLIAKLRGERVEHAKATEPITDGSCSTCEWCDDSEQVNGFCHAHPYTRKPSEYEIGEGVHPGERVLSFPVVIPRMDWCSSYQWDGQTRVASPPVPAWVCYGCGIELYGLPRGMPTWHVGTCDICGKKNIPVTEARDFG